jgi:hypothetical protein
MVNTEGLAFIVITSKKLVSPYLRLLSDARSGGMHVWNSHSHSID